MGKPTGKKKETVTLSAANSNGKLGKPSKAFDEDTAMFLNMSQELKEEGNRLFQKKDHEGAMLQYEKALKLLPKNHIDVAHLRTNMATCYMQLGLGEYPRAINECNLALGVYPTYSKALLKRANCYRVLNRIDLALRDVRLVLGVEPKNLTALELFESLGKTTEEKGVSIDEKVVASDTVHNTVAPTLQNGGREKVKKKRGKKVEDKVVVEEKVSAVKDEQVVSKTIEEEKRVVESVEEDKPATRAVKLVFAEDIRWAHLPVKCSLKLVRDIARDRFPGLKGVLVKYRDQEGDLVTITTTDELRLAEFCCPKFVSFRLYITEVDLDQEPSYDGISNGDEVRRSGGKPSDGVENGGVEEGRPEEVAKRNVTVEDWLLQFARLFKNHVGFESDSYLDIHGLAMKLYAEAMEDMVTSDDAQGLFEIAADKFQEMAALALLNWGSVQMSRARNRGFFSEDGSRASSLEHIKAAYESALEEYKKAGMRYEEALKIKPDFYEGYLALGQQQFEQARLCWCYAIACKMDLETGPSDEVLPLYNKAEASMEKGMSMWEEIEEQRLNGISKSDKHKAQLEKLGLDSLYKDISYDEASKQAAKMRSQIYLLWGALLYERSVVEFKLRLLTWEECLEVAVEKFELAGTSSTDIAVIIKNHCSNEMALEGMGWKNVVWFKIDEIVQAWNEIYDAQGAQFGDPSFRLEQLFRRRVPKLHYIMEQF
ncbi:protein PHOX1-like [Abrus precatorius]|uniref:Protein PHOX1-like n=1 Tax=Abrus precatorius TaxID=3816 RepID=A0A8B8LL26_ABRPR|nr:protein PHOX1-like [Abrus precatorius]